MTIAHASPPPLLSQLLNVEACAPHRAPIEEAYPLILLPQPGAIGTMSLEEALTVLTFEGNKVHTQHLFRSAVPMMGASSVHLPVISSNLVGVAQERRFLLFDFKRKTCGDFTLSGDIHNSVEKMEALDPDRRLFLSQIQHQNPDSEDWHDAWFDLKVMDLSGTKTHVLRSRTLDHKGYSWFVRDRKIFLLDIRKGHLEVLTPEFTPTSHPLQEVLARHENELDFATIQMHPTLPFAVLTGRGGGVLVHWDATRADAKPVCLLDAWDWFTFSPDGKWGAFCKNPYPQPYALYVVPISERLPHYFGNPVFLQGGTEFRASDTGWTPPPTRFVASKLKELLWWDLQGSSGSDLWKQRVEKDLARISTGGALPPSPSRGTSFTARLQLSAAETRANQEDVFTLWSTNGAYRQSHSLKEARPSEAAGCVDLVFTQLLPDTSYTLEWRKGGPQAAPQAIFKDHPYAMLCTDAEP